MFQYLWLEHDFDSKIKQSFSIGKYIYYWVKIDILSDQKKKSFIVAS